MKLINLYLSHKGLSMAQPIALLAVLAHLVNPAQLEVKGHLPQETAQISSKDRKQQQKLNSRQENNRFARTNSKNQKSHR